MLDNNVKRQHYFDYHIIHDGQNWYAWYEWDTETLFEELNENDSNR